jgi:hypothetical protein
MKKEVQQTLDKMEKNQSEVNVDDAVVPSAPLYKQLVQMMGVEY